MTDLQQDDIDKSAWLPDESLWEVFVRSSPPPFCTGYLPLDLAQAKNRYKHNPQLVVEVAGESGAGKTTFLNALACTLLSCHLAGRSDTSGLDTRASVIWFDCDCTLDVAALYSTLSDCVMQHIRAAHNTQSSATGDAQHAADELADCLRRLHIVRVGTLGDLVDALSSQAWIGLESPESEGQGQGKRARPGGAVHGGGGGGGQPWGMHLPAVPALIIADGLGDMLWRHAAHYASPSPLSPSDYWGEVDACMASLLHLARSYTCPLLWSRRMLFKVQDLPAELRSTSSVPLQPQLQSALHDAVRACSSPLLTPSYSMACGWMAAHAQQQHGMGIAGAVEQGRQSVAWATPYFRHESMSIPSIPSLWRPERYMFAKEALWQILPQAGPGAYLVAHTCATICVARAGHVSVTACSSDVGGGSLFTLPFVLRWLSAAVDLPWVKSAEQGEALSQAMAARATQGMSVHSTGPAYTQGQTLIPVVWEAGMVSVVRTR